MHKTYKTFVNKIRMYNLNAPHKEINNIKRRQTPSKWSLKWMCSTFTEDILGRTQFGRFCQYRLA